MRLSEIVTLYLAAAAPAGVAHFLRHDSAGGTRTRAVARASLAALSWPLALGGACLRAVRRAPRSFVSTETRSSDETGVARVETLARALCAACVHHADALRARAVVERYVGLSLAEHAARPDAPSTPRELELCRVAGRRGADLLLAGQCVRRNNAARLHIHRERARQELLRLISAIVTRADEQQSTPAELVVSRADEVEARARELFAALEDREALSELARTREHAAHINVAVAGADIAREGESCLAPHSPDTPPRQSAYPHTQPARASRSAAPTRV